MTNAESIYFKFEKLDVWQRARKFANEIYVITHTFPQSELFGITNQVRRSAVSIMLNIAEGSERQSDADFRRFVQMAIGSLNETVASLYLASDTHLIRDNKFQELYQDAGHLAAQLKALAKKLYRK
ncbi:MAG: S23 ribosomal protein [Parcubacteria group bacterium GW2011_GWB1_52_7]|nr:MAG: S23 ribosomal protein [Parcubacteria group bacterium GW2011_GWA1_51_12]KKW28337.1 MAG: S23 ribosomal protein [Parcubacteria group bacterium GW2011_GWB1_52_7]